MMMPGVVLTVVRDKPNEHYITRVQLDCSGKVIEVRFPDQKRCGQAVVVKT